MKKLYKIIGIVFIFISIFFSSFSVNIAKADTVWTFKELVTGKEWGPYKTLALCNADLTVYYSNYALTSVSGVSDCYTKDIPGTGVIFDTQNVPVPITGQTGDQLTTPDATYKLLAPIAGLTEAPTNIGDYFNKIFLVAIGLCGALAVIMIVIGGVQYMGNDSIFGKTEAKSHIAKSIFGLLIALGSYALLNTINPDLLGKKGVTISQVTADITEMPLVNESIPQYGSKTGTCTDGLYPVVVIDVGGKSPIMNVCKSISDKVTALISDAYYNGKIKLTGNSYRSYEDQVQARKDNGCIDIYKESKCRVATAVPGTSLHESGKAIDFKCDGQFINIGTAGDPGNARPETKVCWDWLKANASRYGLYNLPSENWHWDIVAR